MNNVNFTYYSTGLYSDHDYDLVNLCIVAQYFRLTVMSERMFISDKNYEVIGSYRPRRCPWFRTLRAPDGEVLVEYYIKCPITSKDFLKHTLERLIVDLSKFFAEDEPILAVPTGSTTGYKDVKDWDFILNYFFKREAAIFAIIGTQMHEHTCHGSYQEKFITVKMLKELYERVKKHVRTPFDQLKTEMRKVYMKSIFEMNNWLKNFKEETYATRDVESTRFLSTCCFMNNLTFEELILKYAEDEDVAEAEIKRHIPESMKEVMEKFFKSNTWLNFKEAAKAITTTESSCMPSVDIIYYNAVDYIKLLM